jgi:hypothetical protein
VNGRAQNLLRSARLKRGTNQWVNVPVSYCHVVRGPIQKLVCPEPQQEIAAFQIWSMLVEADGVCFARELALGTSRAPPLVLAFVMQRTNAVLTTPKGSLGLDR